jgi:hypothetical protein
MKKPAQGMHNALIDTQLLAEIIKNSDVLKSMMNLTVADEINTNENKKARTTLYI